MKKLRMHKIIPLILLFVLALCCQAASAQEDLLQAKVNAVIQECIQPEMTTYEKALALHNWVIDNVEYDDVDGPGGEGHSAYDAIVLGRGVCQAYATGYAALLDAAGITNAYEYGYDHVWNLVQMNDQWYHIDCTWNDSTSKSNTYLFLPNDALADVGNHECYNNLLTGHDYTYSYLYRSGLLDKKLNSITSYIQQQFERGIFEFLFIPEVSLHSANGSGFGDSRVEFNLVKMILPEYSYSLDGKTVEAEITLNWDTGIVSVRATAPEGWVPDVNDTPDPETAFIFEAFEGNPRYRLSQYTGSASRVVIPDGVKEIGESAFSGCSTIHELIISNSVVSIRNYAFYGCINLKNVQMSRNLASMESYAFAGCTSLKEISLPDSLKELPYSTFQECLSLKKVRLPADLQSMGSHCFYKCSSLESIEIPGTVERIPYSAFNSCISLRRAEIGEGVQEIDEHVFYGCSSLERINFPKSLTSIGEWSFADCSSLQEVVWPEQIAVLPVGIFHGCTSLRSIKLPNSMSIISINAFGDCFSLQQVQLPANLKEIHTYAFRDCTSLKKIDIPDTVSLIDDRAFTDTDCIWMVTENSYAQSRAEQLMQRYEIAQQLMPLMLPANLDTVAAEAFLGAAVQQVILPDGLSQIDERAFADCSELLQISMPDSITFIAENAFESSNWVEFICESDNAAAAYARRKGIPFTIGQP